MYVCVHHELSDYVLFFDVVNTTKTDLKAEIAEATAVTGLEISFGQVYEQYERLTGLYVSSITTTEGRTSSINAPQRRRGMGSVEIKSPGGCTKTTPAGGGIHTLFKKLLLLIYMENLLQIGENEGRVAQCFIFGNEVAETTSYLGLSVNKVVHMFYVMHLLVHYSKKFQEFKCVKHTQLSLMLLPLRFDSSHWNECFPTCFLGR